MKTIKQEFEKISQEFEEISYQLERLNDRVDRLEAKAEVNSDKIKWLGTPHSKQEAFGANWFLEAIKIILIITILFILGKAVISLF